MFRGMIASPRLRALVAALAACLTVGVVATAPGCGGSPEFDKSVQHTPETLVEEFMIRYRNLPDQATAKQQAKTAKEAAARAKLPDVDSGSGKSSRKEAAIKDQAAAQTQTLENILDALYRRLGSVGGLSRKEATATAIELIKKEPDIKDEDRKVVIERLSK